LGLRTESPISADVSKANSIKSHSEDTADGDSLEGVKTSGPTGEESLEAALNNVNLDDLPKPQGGAPTPTLKEVNAGLDTASATTPERAAES
jgi:protein-tyrosine phosphatase